MGLRAVRGDGRAVVAEVDVGLVAGDALAGDAGALEAADELFGLAREHGAGDDFEDAGGGGLLHGFDSWYEWRGAVEMRELNAYCEGRITRGIMISVIRSLKMLTR